MCIYQNSSIENLKNAFFLQTINQYLFCVALDMRQIFRGNFHFFLNFFLSLNIVTNTCKQERRRKKQPMCQRKEIQIKKKKKENYSKNTKTQS